MNAEDSTPRRGPLPEISTLLIDRNRDGFPDDIVGMIAIPEDLDRETWEAVLNLSARLGLGSSGFTPPIVAREPLMGRVSVTVRSGDAERLTALALGDESPEESPPDDATAPREPLDLADPWSIDGLLADRDGDQAADDSAIHLILPKVLSFEIGAALADLATRIGVESGALTFPITGSNAPGWRKSLRINITEDSGARLTQDSDGNLTLTGGASPIAAAIRRLAAQSSGFLPDVPGISGVAWLRRSIAGWTPEGRSAQLRHALQQTRPERVTILAPDPIERQGLMPLAQRKHQDILVETPSPRETVVFDHQWTAEWEVDRLFTSLEQEIFPALDPDLPVHLIAMISEPPAIRRRVRGQISRRMLEIGFQQGTVHVLDAFKPGLGWLQEIILPEIRELGEIGQIQIQARSWDSEEHDGKLDMSIRWLQELFPVDEILAAGLDLSLNQIELSLSGEIDSLYTVTVRNTAGELALERAFSPLWRRMNYLTGMPGAGSVTVTTGGVVATQSGKTSRARVLTDPEVFWRYMQGELQPNLRRFILGLTNSEPGADEQPFFEELLVDVRLSASDHPYGIRQERHSAAEALHEDIYFNVLDFVEEIGQITTGEKLGAPGAVLPFVTAAPGRQPEARVRLTRRPAGIARIVADGEAHIVKPCRESLPAAPVVSSLEFDSERLIIELEQTSELDMISEFLSALAAESPSSHSATVLRVPVRDGRIEIGLPDPSRPPIPDNVAAGPVPDDTIISNRELFPHLNRLAKHPPVSLSPAAEVSWRGRPIPAVAVTAPQEAAVWSMRKLSHFKPTMLIVARHHANEVASTTSALQLIDALVTDGSGEAMLNGVNVVILPLENPDGAALHDQLRRGNPTWKHHPAHYNATGYEFGEDQGAPDSRYGEGRVRDLVWSACLPDIVVDNHGVPSHEWAQLFAGFGSPPRFSVSYWQVQALLYGILPGLDDPAHHAARSTVRERVAAVVAADVDLLHWNRIYTDRYRTWGHQWLPERFPLTLFNEMQFHMSTIDPDSSRGRRSYAARYPRTTILDWITEVCDETVEGEELARTSRAHLLANKTVLELLREYTRRPVARSVATESGVQVRIGRERPLRIETLCNDHD